MKDFINTTLDYFSINKFKLSVLQDLFNNSTPKNNKYLYLLRYMDENKTLDIFNDSVVDLKTRVADLSKKLKIKIIYSSFFKA